MRVKDSELSKMPSVSCVSVSVGFVVRGRRLRVQGFGASSKVRVDQDLRGYTGKWVSGTKPRLTSQIGRSRSGF